MINIIFYALCGVLYVIGLIFGWTYKETSIYICIYGCPIICILSALLSVIYCGIKSLFRTFICSINASLLIFYIILTKIFWVHFLCSQDKFELCKYDLINIAGKLGITYNECNLYVYCILFPAIVVFHIIQIFIFKKLHNNNQNK